MSYYNKYLKYKQKFFIKLYGGGISNFFDKFNTKEDLIKHILELANKSKLDIKRLQLLIHLDQDKDSKSTENFKKIKPKLDNLINNWDIDKDKYLNELNNIFVQIYCEYKPEKCETEKPNQSYFPTIGTIAVTAIGSALLAGIFFAVTGMWGGSNNAENGLNKFSNIFKSSTHIDNIIEDFKIMNPIKINNTIENLHILLTKNLISEDKEAFNNNVNYKLLIKYLSKHKSEPDFNLLKQLLIDFRNNL